MPNERLVRLTGQDKLIRDAIGQDELIRDAIGKFIVWPKYYVSVFLVMLIVLVAQSQLFTKSEAQTCSASLANLNACAPFVVPGATATTPSTDCCTALQSVDHECLCSTLRIASRVPAQCNLPPLSCSAN